MNKEWTNEQTVDKGKPKIIYDSERTPFKNGDDIKPPL